MSMKMIVARVLCLALSCHICALGATNTNTRTTAAKKARQAPSKQVSQLKSFNYELGVAAESYSYHETQNNEQVMKISGLMYGVQGGITHNVTSSFRHSLNAAYYTSANTRYDGHVCPNQGGRDQCQPYKVDSSDWFSFAQYMINPRVQIDDAIIGYNLGAGYRYLFNDVDSISAYRREQHYVYYLLGLDISAPLSPRVYASFMAQYRGLIKGWNKSYATDIGWDYDLSFTQTRGSGYYLALRGDYKYNRNSSYFMKIYYEYWNILDSDFQTAYQNGQSLGSYVEPNNYTHSIGVNVGLAF